MRQLLNEGKESSLSGLLGGNDNELTAKKVHQAALQGDSLALEVVDETAHWLGIGITTLVHTVDPGPPKSIAPPRTIRPVHVNTNRTISFNRT